VFKKIEKIIFVKENHKTLQF